MRLRVQYVNWFLALALCMGLMACQRQEQARRYEIKGKVVSVEKEQKQIMLDHEAIPGFMEAMTMGYAVRDDRALNELAPGDEITAALVVSGDSSWLQDIVIEKKSESGGPPEAGTIGNPGEVLRELTAAVS